MPCKALKTNLTCLHLWFKLPSQTIKGDDGELEIDILPASNPLAQGMGLCRNPQAQ